MLKIMLFSIAIIVSPFTYSYVDGEITPIGGTHIYNFDLTGNSFPSNILGDTLDDGWDESSSYNATVHCSSNHHNEARHFKATSSMALSSENPGYYFVNEYIDVKVHVWIDGNRNEFVKVPFDNESNLLFKVNCDNGDVFDVADVYSGSKGKLEFILKKPLINGLVINDTELVKVFGRAGNATSAFGDIPLSIAKITTAIITVPDKCIINSGSPIEVNFGDIPNISSVVNGNNYNKEVPIAVKCEGGSFDTGSMKITLALNPVGINNSFDPLYLGTNKDNLSIAIRHNGSLVEPGVKYPLTNFVDNQGSWDLTVSPIINPGVQSIIAGSFDAYASLVAEFL